MIERAANESDDHIITEKNTWALNGVCVSFNAGSHQFQYRTVSPEVSEPRSPELDSPAQYKAFCLLKLSSESFLNSLKGKHYVVSRVKPSEWCRVAPISIHFVQAKPIATREECSKRSECIGSIFELPLELLIAQERIRSLMWELSGYYTLRRES